MIQIKKSLDNGIIIICDDAKQRDDVYKNLEKGIRQLIIIQKRKGML